MRRVPVRHGRAKFPAQQRPDMHVRVVVVQRQIAGNVREGRGRIDFERVAFPNLRNREYQGAQRDRVRDRDRNLPGIAPIALAPNHLFGKSSATRSWAQRRIMGMSGSNPPSTAAQFRARAPGRANIPQPIKTCDGVIIGVGPVYIRHARPSEFVRQSLSPTAGGSGGQVAVRVPSPGHTPESILTTSTRRAGAPN